MLRFDSRNENSVSESPCSMITFEDLRRCIRLLAYVVNEKHILRLGLGGFEIDDFVLSSLVVTVVESIIVVVVVYVRMKMRLVIALLYVVITSLLCFVFGENEVLMRTYN